MINSIPVLSHPDCIITVLAPEQAELALAYQLENRHHLAQWEPLRSSAYYQLATWRTLLQQQQQLCLSQQGFHFAALNKHTGEMVASINFSHIIRGVFHSCHLGYSIDHRYQGQGLMTSLCQVSLRYIFEQQDLHRIMASHVPENARSKQLLLKLGFEAEGFAHSYLKVAGQWRDHYLYSLLNPAH